MNDLIQLLYNGEIKPLTTEKFIVASWNQHDHLKGYSQKDAHEYLMALRSSLHKCLIKNNKNNLNNKNNINANSKNGMGKHKKLKQNKDCNCFIHKLFLAVERSEIKCRKCNHISAVLCSIEEISLDLTVNEKDNDKNNSNQNNNN
eukprot:UN28563